MTRKPKQNAAARRHGEPATLATVLAGLESTGKLAPTRLRDMRSAVKRVATLLGNDPAAIPLNMGAISAGLADVTPVAHGMTAKRFANVRSDFLAAVKASGMKPVQAQRRVSVESRLD